MRAKRGPHFAIDRVMIPFESERLISMDLPISKQETCKTKARNQPLSGSERHPNANVVRPVLARPAAHPEPLAGSEIHDERGGDQ